MSKAGLGGYRKVPKASGRPSKLTQEIQDKIVMAVRVGNFTETAAALAGIHKSTLYDWLKRGAREKDRLTEDPKAKPITVEAPYVIFSDAVEMAMALSEFDDVAVISKSKDWKARAWRLERKHSERWGRADKLTLDGKMDMNHAGEVKIDVFSEIQKYAALFYDQSDDTSLQESDAGSDGPKQPVHSTDTDTQAD